MFPKQTKTNNWAGLTGKSFGFANPTLLEIRTRRYSGRSFLGYARYRSTSLATWSGSNRLAVSLNTLPTSPTELSRIF